MDARSSKSQARRLSAVGGNQAPPGGSTTSGRQRPVSGDMRRRRRAAIKLVSSDEGADEVNRAVAAAKAGDRDAFCYLYVRYADDVYRYVRRIVRDVHEAEDVTQQVFTKLMTALPKYEQREVPFLGWVLRVARNLALDHLRSLRAVPCDEVRGPEADADDYAGDRSLTLREALASLPRDQHTVLIMRLLLGLSPGEIAQRIGRSEGAVHGLHHRGRAAMRMALVRDAAGPATMPDGG
jgi:RNA polymerase sigma-70 factor, ECF subfamily